MPSYLLEIGVEELPADQVVEGQERLQDLMSQALRQANLPFEAVDTLGTPRRLACLVKGLDAWQATTHKKVKGPPVKSSFDAQGQPLPAASGFAHKQGLTVDQLEREEIGGLTYLVANVVMKGRPAAEVLPEIVPAVIEKISGERLMRWGSSTLRFSRPIRWLVSLLDDNEVPLTLGGLQSGRQSQGHRILAPGLVHISSGQTYRQDLRAAKVLVDAAARRDLIVQQVTALAQSISGIPKQLKGALLQEVVNLTEWPCAVLGEFEKEYLDLPDTLIETVMIHHQRYFPLERQNPPSGLTGKLLPYFISIANNDHKQAQPIIKQGNERVLRARLADGRFFYFDDQKTDLSKRTSALGQLTFQEGLGSYLDKQERLVQVARQLAAGLGLEARIAVCLERTLQLCKLDLVTNLVRELPELQGYVGSWYAQAAGEPPNVVTAITSHYCPRSSEDTIPADPVGQLASLLDKLDNLVSIFALGKRPSGSSDPFALRRQAQGIVDILVEGLNYPVNLLALINHLLDLLAPWLSSNQQQRPELIKAEVHDFLKQRLRIKLLDKGFRREVVEAVLAARDPLLNIPDVLTRLRVLEQLSRSTGGQELMRAGVRVGNILSPTSPDSVKPELLSEPAEKKLWESFQQSLVQRWNQGNGFKQPSQEQEYNELLGLLQPICPLIEQLFEQVLINDPDKLKRDNRHGLLRQIDVYFRSLADFPALQPLLP